MSIPDVHGLHPLTTTVRYFTATIAAYRLASDGKQDKPAKESKNA